MAKYDALRDHLRRQGASSVVMTFGEISLLVPGGLPPSAYEYEAWWANEESGSHVQAQAWLAAGYESTNVSLIARRATFVRRSRRP